MAHREPAARARGDQSFLLELTHRFAQGAAADLQRVGQFGFHQVGARRQLPGGDRAAQRAEGLFAQAGFSNRSSDGASIDIGRSP